MAPPSTEDGASSDKPPPPNWAKIYSDLVCHTSIGPFDIPEMTLPQIDAIRAELGENIAIKIGMPGLFGGATDIPTTTDKPSKLSDWMNFANAFNGI